MKGRNGGRGVEWADWRQEGRKGGRYTEETVIERGRKREGRGERGRDGAAEMERQGDGG